MNGEIKTKLRKDSKKGKRREINRERKNKRKKGGTRNGETKQGIE